MRFHQDIAFRTAYLITGSAADADGAVQDGFLKAYRALGRFRRDAPFRPWLLTIVANEARNRVGRRGPVARRPLGALRNRLTWGAGGRRLRAWRFGRTRRSS